MKSFFKKILLVLFITVVSGNLYSQEINENITVEDSIIYNRFHTYGVTFHNFGLGVNYRWGERLNVYKNRFFEVEAQSLRSWKQVKMVNPYIFNAKSYVYGKVNNAFVLHFGLFFDKRINRKSYEFEKGVGIRWVYGGGAGLGIAKPYYYYVVYFYGMYDYEIKEEKFDPNPTYDDIYGRAPFTKGFDELSFYPGVYFKTGLNFEYGNKKTKINYMEVGFAMDILPTGLTIMYAQQNKIFYPILYINLSWGKRFNKY